tara:strand:- start:1683 stop:2048 length:366 start_codon:yes stop_codon:yes gene_type:complete
MGEEMEILPCPDLVEVEEFTEYLAIVTAYSPDEKCCAPFADGKTSIGKNAFTKGIAVDPQLIPYGSMIEFNGNLYEADDTGSAMRRPRSDGKIRLDLRFFTYDEAINFGVMETTVKVYAKR